MYVYSNGTDGRSSYYRKLTLLRSMAKGAGKEAREVLLDCAIISCGCGCEVLLSREHGRLGHGHDNYVCGA